MPKLVANDIAIALKKRISLGEWMENGRMPPERDLASEFGVARNTVRRAVGLLEEDGTVVRHVGRGTFLAAASFAATNASAGELNAVREAHKIACASQDMPTFEHWDAEFHHRIFACSRNDFLKEIHNLMRILRNQRPWFEMKKRSFSEERRATYCSEHQVVLDALLARDSEGASDAMLTHLRTVERNLLGR